MSDNPRILFVVTNNDQLGNTNEETGYWLSEVSHPYNVFDEAGYTIDFVSPQGGPAPVDPLSEDYDDPINAQFVESEAYTEQLQNTLTPSEVNSEEYDAIFFAGGYGPMWDLPDNEEIASLVVEIYEAGKIVSAVCHGPAGLVNVQRSDGEYLVAGKRVASFTNAEEDENDRQDVVPFLLESELEVRGADHHSAGVWDEQIEVDGRLVTGQNPASAKGVAESVIDLIEENK
jgi:putative intracellular protease/amidase